MCKCVYIYVYIYFCAWQEASYLHTYTQAQTQTGARQCVWSAASVSPSSVMIAINSLLAASLSILSLPSAHPSRLYPSSPPSLHHQTLPSSIPPFPVSLLRFPGWHLVRLAGRAAPLILPFPFFNSSLISFSFLNCLPSSSPLSPSYFKHDCCYKDISNSRCLICGALVKVGRFDNDTSS